MSDPRRLVVIEASFRPRSEYERVTHPVHVVTTLHPEQLAEYDRPVGIGALVTVDTTVPVDVGAVAAAVRHNFDRAIN